MRLEIVIDIHTEVLHRKVLDMPDRGHDVVIGPEIFVDGFRLCGRFYYY